MILGFLVLNTHNCVEWNIGARNRHGIRRQHDALHGAEVAFVHDVLEARCMRLDRGGKVSVSVLGLISTELLANYWNYLVSEKEFKNTHRPAAPFASIAGQTFAGPAGLLAVMTFRVGRQIALSPVMTLKHFLL